MEEVDYNSKIGDSRNYMTTIKSKRTKRQRSPSPLALTMASTSSTTADQDSHNPNSATFFNMTTNSINFIQENDEHDMANCLILLAQGPQSISTSTSNSNSNSKSHSPPPNNYNSSYECKTCNRGFPSFQALGGHRASHKKPPKPTLQLQHNSKPQHFTCTTTLSLEIGLDHEPQRTQCNPSGSMKVKVHECSICGAEFGSGQALGGHMRRHRSMSLPITNSSESKKPKVLLSLDLNLPAPIEDDIHHMESKFTFQSKDQLIVFSKSSLVHCQF